MTYLFSYIITKTKEVSNNGGHRVVKDIVEVIRVNKGKNVK